MPYAHDRSLHLALAVGALAAATLVAALIFEHGFGYVPCPLCLRQRWPYYIGVPLALAVTLAVWRRAPRAVLTWGFALLALVFLVSAGLGIQHAGVEWKLWAGPAGCSGGSVASSAGSLLGSLQETTHVARCDEASWRFLGLSFAGWNGVISLALAGIAVLGARR
jgi:disulfide bond formation protein DsbB